MRAGLHAHNPAPEVTDLLYYQHQYSSAFGNDAVGISHGSGRLDSRQGWSAAANNGSQWMQFSVDELTAVWGVQTLGRSDAAQWVSQFMVESSTDGHSFYDQEHRPTDTL